MSVVLRLLQPNSLKFRQTDCRTWAMTQTTTKVSARAISFWIIDPFTTKASNQIFCRICHQVQGKTTLEKKDFHRIIPFHHQSDKLLTLERSFPFAARKLDCRGFIFGNQWPNEVNWSSARRTKRAYDKPLEKSSKREGVRAESCTDSKYKRL